MFATPFTASFSPTLGQQLLGRFWSRRDGGTGAAAEAAVQPVTHGEAEDEAFPDLAQRVREVGEW